MSMHAITASTGTGADNPFYNSEGTPFPPLGMISATAEGVDCLPVSYQYLTPTRKICKSLCQAKGFDYKQYRKGQAGDCRYVCSCKIIAP